MEIPKFRAWHKELQKMLPVNGIININSNMMIYAHDLPLKFTSNLLSLDEVALWKPHEIELMQWTGFNDVNDAPIFDSDIIQWDKSWVEKTFSKGCVRWDKKTGHWVVRRNMHISDGGLWAHFDFPKPKGWPTIVGNIYENPELLNEI